MSNTTVRILVAVVGIPCIIAISLLGGFWFWGLVALISTGAVIELYRLFEAKGIKPLIVDGVLWGILITLTFEANRIVVPAGLASGTFAEGGLAARLVLTAAIFVCFTLWALFRTLFSSRDGRLLNGATTVFGVAYVPVFLGTLIGIRELFTSEWALPRVVSVGVHVTGEAGIRATDAIGGMTVVSIFAIIWICDSAAYFGGRATGKHKLFERVSPKKTWEGALWGLIGAVGAAIAAKYLALSYLTLVESIVVGAIIGIFGQFGDLAESALKRDAGVKDSSTIIPGHGGILDRFDSLLFVSPILYGYLGIIVRYPV